MKEPIALTVGEPDAAPSAGSASWRVGFPDGSGEEYILDGNGESIAVLRWGCGCCKDNSPLSKREQERARLISAAPDLYEALKWCVEKGGLHYTRRIAGQNDGWCDAIDKINAAIAKATPNLT